MEQKPYNLTSVKIMKKNYNDFKKKTQNTDITLQKLVNRTIELYLNDESFKKIIDNHETCGVKNSKY